MRRFKNSTALPYSLPETPLTTVCPISSSLPSLLVHVPSISWRATCVGIPSLEAKTATFSNVVSTSPESVISYPIVANASRKLATDSSRLTSAGQYEKGDSAGHHHRVMSPAAQATQLYVGSGGLVISNPLSRRRGNSCSIISRIVRSGSSHGPIRPMRLSFAQCSLPRLAALGSLP